MFTKKISWLLSALLFYGINTSYAIGEEQREILYTLYEMQQDFASVPMITQNIDMWIGMVEMEIQVLNRKLTAINKELRATIIYGLGWAGVSSLVRALVAKGSTIISPYYPSMQDYLGFAVNNTNLAINSIYLMGNVYCGMSFYDAIKERSRLMKLLQLNKAVLEQLEEVKYSNLQNSQPAPDAVSAETAAVQAE